MKKLLIGLMAFALCTSHMHAMQMETAKTKSSTNAYGNAVKACCYLTAVCGLMMTPLITEGRPVAEHKLCKEAFQMQAQDLLQWARWEEYRQEHAAAILSEEDANHVHDIEKRIAQSEKCLKDLEKQEVRYRRWQEQQDDNQ